MFTYVEQLNNKIDLNEHKLASLQEYKKMVLDSKEQMPKDLFEERTSQIEMELARLEKSIHANKKAIAHYNAAYNHLMDLRDLDSKLQLATDEKEKESLEQEILTHTDKLQRHLTILPEKLVTELQKQYLRYVEENTTPEDANGMEELVAEPSFKENKEVETTSETESIPVVDQVIEEFEEEQTVSFEENLIYIELLKIFEQEKEEFNRIKVFETPTDLEEFLNKYRELKMRCYTRLALLTDIGSKIHAENAPKKETFSVAEEQTVIEEPQIEQPSRAPIVIMLDLVEGLEIQNDSTKELRPTNVAIAESFKEELVTSDWLYNVIHYCPDVIYTEEESKDEFIKKVSVLEKNDIRLAVLKDRIEDLSDTNLIRVYNEYYAGNKNTRMTTILQLLLEERAKELV